MPVLLLCAALFALTLIAFWPSVHNDFVGFDDDDYVVANPHVTGGVTWQNVQWAFLSSHSANWHPLAWLSHMLDCQLFQLQPWGHHLTSLLIHAANTVLLFLVLRRMTGATWRSFFVAAIFGLHPLRVESVAWVAERKDVLSTLFWLLALGAYARFGEASRVRGAPARRFYALALVLFALGLMSKPMLVTVPFALLLLDFWPLERWKHTNLINLLWEKVPFFLLAIVSSVITFRVQQNAGAMGPIAPFPLAERLQNIPVAYCRYLGKLFWPVNLSVFYPHPGHWPIAVVFISTGILLAISVLAVLFRREYPFVLFGWLWFLGTLVPAIGLIQVGAQSMADRYSYVPSIGVLIIIAWGAGALAENWLRRAWVLGFPAAAAMMLCLLITRIQVSYWRNAESLFRHASAVTDENWQVHDSLGGILYHQARYDEAISQYHEVLRLKPGDPNAHNSLGTIFFEQGRVNAALHEFSEAVQLKPEFAGARINMASALVQAGRIPAAITQYQEVLRFQPGSALAHNNLGLMLARTGRVHEAVEQYREAIKLRPENANAHNNLGTALAGFGRLPEAIAEFQEAVRLNPDYGEARHNLNVALKTAQAADPKPGASAGP